MKVFHHADLRSYGPVADYSQKRAQVLRGCTPVGAGKSDYRGRIWMKVSSMTLTRKHLSPAKLVHEHSPEGTTGQPVAAIAVKDINQKISTCGV
jgi:hypothetical protein